MKTIRKKGAEIKGKWYVIDAENKILGRVAVKAAEVLRGKHRADFVPNMCLEDHVIILNADKICLSAGKERKKLYHRHTLYPGGLRTENFTAIKAKKPTFPLEQAVKGMLPKGPLGRKIFRNLRVYTGSSHPHQGQAPEELSL